MKGLLICAVLMGPAGQAPEPKRVQFQPGVVIDWAHRQVEIDSTVVLREGLLELVACTPKSREHEALVRVNAQAVHIYMALGLIGVQPGKQPENGRRRRGTRILGPTRARS